jgi:hypothetical protein
MFTVTGANKNGGIIMQTELRLMVAAIAAALPLLSAHAQTIDFGPALSPGVVPDGYDGFNWHGADNGDLYDTSLSGFGSAAITEMSRASPFDLNSMVVQELESEVPDGGDTSAFVTVISGYLNGTLVKTVTENYNWGGDTVLSGINMNDVNDITFKTTYIDTPPLPQTPILFTAPGVLVSQLTVADFSGVANAPELDPASIASALTLTVGSLLVIRGRRRKEQAVAR